MAAPSSLIVPVSPHLLTPEPFQFNEEELNRMLIAMSRAGASDIKIQTNNYVHAKIQGDVHRINGKSLPKEEVEGILRVLYGMNGPARLQSGMDIDRAYELTYNRNERYRFRVNAVGGLRRGQDGMEITLRTIKIDPPTMADMKVCQGIIDGAFPQDGIVWVAGPTGSGKSTLLSSFIRYILELPNGNKFIVTFEAPIEYVYDTIFSPSSLIWQTEIGLSANLPSFADGIRNAMRRAPDIILTGETRDIETAEGSMAAAQSGHAVYTTLHSDSVAQTFGRVVNLYPIEARASALSSMLSATRMVIWQRLYKTPDGQGRVPVRSYLNFTEEVREELLQIGTEDMNRIYFRIREMVAEKGESIGQCATRLHAEGKLRNSDFLALKDKV